MDFIIKQLYTLLSAAKRRFYPLIEQLIISFPLKLALFCAFSLLSLLPLCLFTSQKMRSLDHTLHEITHLTHTLSLLRSYSALPSLEKEAHSSTLSLPKKLEQLPLLQKEKSKLQHLVQKLPSHLALKNRLAFLERHQIHFEKSQDRGSLKPCYFLSHPVQMDEDDLIAAFHLIKNHPNCDNTSSSYSFKRFELCKQSVMGGDKVYLMDMELLER